MWWHYGLPMHWSFFKNFCWTHVHLWGHWYPCFELLMMSPLGFKAKVGSALFALGRGICVTCSLRFPSGATPLLVYNASIAASCLPHMHVSVEVGCQDLNCQPPACATHSATATGPVHWSWHRFTRIMRDTIWCKLDLVGGGNFGYDLT